jgi:LysM repeat protein
MKSKGEFDMNTKNNKIEKKKKFSEKNILSISIILMLLSLCIIGVVNIVISDRREVLKNQSVEPVLGMIEEAEESENSLVPAYTIKVGDFQVSLGSKEQVVQLLNKVKSQYDEGEEFTISLKESTSEKEDASEEELIYQAEILRPVITENQLQAVLAAGNGTSSHTAQAEEGAEDGKMMAFEETIEVFEEKLEPSSVITFEEAYNTLMQGSNREEIYVVEEGDCLSEIALKNNIDMEKILEANPVLVDQESILPGQELALVSAKPMIDILTVEKSIYEENILPEPEYIYNNNWYSNREEIKEEGYSRSCPISALVTYRNGVEAGREIVVRENLGRG